MKFMKRKTNILVSKGQEKKLKRGVYSSSHALTHATPPVGTGLMCLHEDIRRVHLEDGQRPRMAVAQLERVR